MEPPRSPRPRRPTRRDENVSDNKYDRINYDQWLTAHNAVHQLLAAARLARSCFDRQLLAEKNNDDLHLMGDDEHEAYAELTRAIAYAEALRIPGP